MNKGEAQAYIEKVKQMRSEGIPPYMVRRQLGLSLGQYTHALKTLRGAKYDYKKPRRQWAREWNSCRRCDRTKYNHASLGLCLVCYSVWKRNKHRFESLESFLELKPHRENMPDLTGQSNVAKERKVVVIKDGEFWEEPKRKVIMKGTHVKIPKWKLEGTALCAPYSWPKGEIRVCDAIDIWDGCMRIDGIPVNLVEAV